MNHRHSTDYDPPERDEPDNHEIALIEAETRAFDRAYYRALQSGRTTEQAIAAGRRAVETMTIP